MADESEMKMEALKKAYAQIFLNTSKEAATRVMAAKRKALCFHHNLVSLKEESLCMFLRLKENFNSKITEAEARSYNQQMKIEELEAQLSEAEGIIVALRDELTQVQEKLETMRHKQKQPLSCHILGLNEPAHECALQDNALNSSPLVISPVSDGKSISADCERKVASLHPSPLINKCSHPMNSNSLTSKSDLDQSHAVNYDITSIMEIREAELYRNGCTQRIRAFDRNLSNVNFPCSSEDNQPMINVQSENKQEAGNSRQCPVTDRGPITSNLILCTGRMENGHESHLADVATVQDREKKRGKSSDKLNRDCLKMLKTSDKPSSAVSCREADLKTVNVNVTSSKEPFFVCTTKTDKKNVKTTLNASEGQLLHNCNRGKDQAIRSLRRSSRKNSRYREAIAVLRRSFRKNCIKSCQQPLPAQDRTPSSDGNLQNPMEVAEKESKDTEFCCASFSDELCTSIEVKVDCDNVVTGREEPGCHEEGNTARSREAFQDKLNPIFANSMLVDAQLFDVPICEGFDDTQTQSQGQAGNDRHLKFTFQRRRRKNTLGKLDQNVVVDSSTGKTGIEKPSDVPELQKYVLKDELNSDGGGMTRAAQQLVSLSGN